MNKIKNKNLVYFLFSILSGILQAMVIKNFSEVGKFYPAGFVGISRLASDVAKDFFNFNLPYSILYFPLNFISLLIVYKKIGKKFALFTLVQVITTSIFTMFMPVLIDIKEPLYLAIFGAVVNGASISIALSNNSSTGGTDLFGVYFSNKYNRSIFNVIFGFNVFILVIVGFIYDFDVCCLSLIFQYISTLVINSLTKHYNKEMVHVVTKHGEEVSKHLIDNMRHGITKIEGKGCYSNSNNTLLFTIVDEDEVPVIASLILEVDPNAFISVSKCKRVFGKYIPKPIE